MAASHQGREKPAKDSVCELPIHREIKEKNHLDIVDHFISIGLYEKAINFINEALGNNEYLFELHNKKGIALSRIGLNSSAIDSYNKAIEINPEFAEAYFNRGLAMQLAHDYLSALDDYQNAVRIKEDYIEAYYNMGTVQQKLCDYENAIRSYDKAICINNNYASAYNNRGIALQELGRFDEAGESYDKAISLKKDHPDGHYNKGLLLKKLGKKDEAIKSYEQAISLKNDFYIAYNSLGIALRESGNTKAAIDCFEKAIKLKGNYRDAYYNKGGAHKDLNEIDKSIDSYKKSIEIDPKHKESYNNIGVVYCDTGQYELSVSYFEMALLLDSTYIDAHYNKGVSLQSLGRIDDAISTYTHVIEMDQGHAESFNNRGACYTALNRLSKALADYDRTTSINPRHAEAFWNKSLVLLLQGKYKEGWPLYEWRRHKKQPTVSSSFQAPLWLGESPLKGQTILIHHEQGYGDFIQFCRYALMLLDQRAKVILAPPAPLAPVIASISREITVVPSGEDLPPFDCQCPAMSLPLAFKTELSSIPASIPYLQAAPEKIATWTNRLGTKTKQRIGLAWSGRETHNNDHNRSIPLQALRPLLNLSCEFHSLQKEIRPADLNVSREFTNLTFHHNELGDFGDTAALIEAMDLVICVDTAVAHLAGALGKPVWILIPYAPDFRWLLDRTDSPWYPTATLFRQKQIGMWDDVISKVSKKLSQRHDKDRVNQDTRRALFLDALARHENGDIPGAKDLYMVLLGLDPHNGEVLRLLGTIECQLSNFEQGVSLLNRSLTVAPDQAATYNNLGYALKELKRHQESLEAYNRAISLKPKYAEALNNRGAVLKDLGRLDEALASCNQAITASPMYAEAHNNKGIILKELGRLDEALECYDRATGINPAYAAPYNNKGVVLKELQLHEAALENFNKAVELHPSYYEAINNKGNVLHKMKRSAEAIICYEKAIKLKPDYSEAYNNKGVSLQELMLFEEAVQQHEHAIQINPTLSEAHAYKGNALSQLQRFQEGMECYAEALKINPRDAMTINNRGFSIMRQHRLMEALENYNRALAVDPFFADAYNNKGTVLQSLNLIPEALECYDKALSLKPDYVEAGWNKALLLLLTGDFANGWNMYELRKKRKDNPATRSPVKPEWLGGQTRKNNTLLIYPEQGFGDYIQLCRYVPLLKKFFNHIILEVPEPLYSLVRTLDGKLTLIQSGENAPPFDFQCPIMSLPYALRTEVPTIPADTPYLYANPEKVEAFRERITSSRLQVGLVWSGNKAFRNDLNRSIPLSELEPLLNIPCDFHCLQKEIRPEQLSQASQYQNLSTHHERIGDFSDTAALIELMDLTISADTSVAHLAGAMGKNVWILLPFAPDFRWMLDRSDSPWYPSAKLFRQNEYGNWQNVIQNIVKSLARLL